MTCHHPKPDRATEPSTYPTHHQHRFKATLHNGVHAVFRLPKTVASACLPAGIETRPRGDHAFASVVIAELNRLRPSGVPAFEGLSETVVIYTIMTQAMTPGADVCFGNWVIRIETTTSNVEILREYLPQFPWFGASIAYEADAESTAVQIEHGDGGCSHLVVGTTRPVLPRGSCFPTPLDAQAFCQPPVSLWSSLGTIDHSGKTHPLQSDLLGTAPQAEPGLVERQQLQPLKNLYAGCTLEWAQRLAGPMPITLAAPRVINRMPGSLQDRAQPKTQPNSTKEKPSPAYA